MSQQKDRRTFLPRNLRQHPHECANLAPVILVTTESVTRVVNYDQSRTYNQVSQLFHARRRRDLTRDRTAIFACEGNAALRTIEYFQPSFYKVRIQAVIIDDKFQTVANKVARVF